MLSFFGIFSAHAASPRRGLGKSSGPRYFRPSLEGFEDRVVPAAPVFSVAEAAPVQPAIIGELIKTIGSSNVNIQDINLQGIAYDAATGVLTATGGTVSGFLGGLPFTTNITNFALELLPHVNPGDACSVLDLKLAPIHLELLGLHVDTSPICLSITAFEDQGILGDLLCGLAGGDLNLLNGGALASGLGQILTNALSQAQPSGDESDICTGECDILNLAVGPLDLNLLGVNVHLDDCDDGPVQVCVSATADEGLLGGLLCGLDDGGFLDDLGNIIGDLDLDDIRGILNDVNEDLGLGLTNQEVNRLARQTFRLIQDGDLSFRDVVRLLRSVNRLVELP